MANKKLFYISNKYKEVLNILDNIPNSSEFICEAILEKAGKTKSISLEDIESLFKKYSIPSSFTQPSLIDKKEEIIVKEEPKDEKLSEIQKSEPEKSIQDEEKNNLLLMMLENMEEE